MLKPFILYDGTLLMTKWYDGINDDVHIDKNKSGFMDCEMFCSYVEKIVVPYLQSLPGNSARALSRWVVIIRTSTTTRLSNFAAQKELKFCACQRVRHQSFSRWMFLFLDR